MSRNGSRWWSPSQRGEWAIDVGELGEPPRLAVDSRWWGRFLQCGKRVGLPWLSFYLLVLFSIAAFGYMLVWGWLSAYAGNLLGLIPGLGGTLGIVIGLHSRRNIFQECRSMLEEPDISTELRAARTWEAAIAIIDEITVDHVSGKHYRDPGTVTGGLAHFTVFCNDERFQGEFRFSGAEVAVGDEVTVLVPPKGQTSPLVLRELKDIRFRRLRGGEGAPSL